MVLAQVVLSSVFADGFFYSAHAQCAPTDKIYIDPRLVPKRPNISPQDIGLLMMYPDANSEVKAQIYKQYMQRNQPIVVPTVRARSWCTQPILVFSNIFRDKTEDVDVPTLKAAGLD